MEKKEYQYYKLIQPYQRHTNIPDNWIYLYSFAFNPESIQPSGTCNMSRINDVQLEVALRWLKLQLKDEYWWTTEDIQYRYQKESGTCHCFHT